MLLPMRCQVAPAPSGHLTPERSRSLGPRQTVRLACVLIARFVVVLDPVPAPVDIDVCDDLAGLRLGDELDLLMASFAKRVVASVYETYDGSADGEKWGYGAHTASIGCFRPPT